MTSTVSPPHPLRRRLQVISELPVRRSAMRSMRTLLGSLVVGVMCVAVAGVDAAAPPTAKKHNLDRKHDKHVAGEVVEVDHGKEKKGGLIKVRAHAEHGKGQNHVVTVHVTHSTNFEFVSHDGKGKGSTKETLAHFRDVHPGEHVRIT